MAEQFYTLLTKIGQAKLANATALGTKVNFAKIKVGDSNGTYYNPIENQEDLKHKVWEGTINSITTDSKNKNWIIIQTLIPASVGGFSIREVGIFDDEDNLLIISKYPETYKPLLSTGSGRDLNIKLIVQVSNTESVTLKLDPSVTIATKEDIKNVEKQIGNIKVPVQSVNNKTGAIELKAEDIKAKDGTNLEKFKENLTSQYEDFKKEAELKISTLDTNDKQARQEILNLQMKLDKEKTIKEIDGESGIGFYDLFENNDNIDTEKSTVNAKSTDIEFKGKQSLKFKEVKFPLKFNKVELNLFDKKRLLVDVVSNTKNVVEVLLEPNIVFNGDKIVIDNKIYKIEKVEEAI